ncbi:hypothetical protein J2S94_003277 [Arthrobacter bambusae]|nr:hypothetical protein [Arthrobacter bambusae]
MTRSLTSLLFRAARLSADGRALRKGPAAVGKRLVRKQVYKRTNGLLAALLRGLLK